MFGLYSCIQYKTGEHGAEGMSFLTSQSLPSIVPLKIKLFRLTEER